MNPNNPTEQELRDWAFSDAEWPDQSWDLFLLWKGRYDWYIKLADDYSCTQRAFFIDLLYYSVAYEYKDSFDQQSIFLAELLREAISVESRELKDWKRKVDLLQRQEIER